MTIEPHSKHGRALIVVNYASSDLLRRNLQSADLGPVRVVVVDNYSTDSERRAIQALAERENWTLVPMRENRGFGAAVNAGARAAFAMDCHSLVLLNPDAQIDAATLASLFEHSETHPLDLVCPLVRDSAGRVVFHGCEVDLRSGAIRGLSPEAFGSIEEQRPGCALSWPRDRWMPWLTGACVAVSKDLFMRLRGFDESYFLYWEDVDLSVRAHRMGGRLVVRKDLTIIHDEGGTQARIQGGGKSSVYYYYNCRNRLLFAIHNLQGWDVARWVLCTPQQSWSILKRGGRRHIVKSPKGSVSALMGTLAGLGAVAFSSVFKPANAARRHTLADSSRVGAS